MQQEKEKELITDAVDTGEERMRNEQITEERGKENLEKNRM